MKEVDDMSNKALVKHSNLPVQLVLDEFQNYQ
jgi:hypothetical protein